MKEIKKLLVCGGGMMGKGIAQIFSTKKDLEITVYDNDEDDIAYSEFILGDGTDDDFAKEKILGIKSDKKIEETPSKKQNFNKNQAENHFQKFMKKKITT